MDQAGGRHSQQDRPATVHRPAALPLTNLPLRALARCTSHLLLHAMLSPQIHNHKKFSFVQSLLICHHQQTAMVQSFGGIDSSKPCPHATELLKGGVQTPIRPIEGFVK